MRLITTYLHSSIIVLVLVNMIQCSSTDEIMDLDPLDKSKVDTAKVDSTTVDSTRFEFCIDSVAYSNQLDVCGNIFMTYRVSLDTMITIAIDPFLVSVRDSCQSYDLAVTNGIEVFLEVAGEPVYEDYYFNYCDDVVFPLPPSTKEPALTGSITLVSEILEVTEESRRYFLNARIDNLSFSSHSKIYNYTYFKYISGWFPG